METVLKIEDVSVKYPARERPVLSNLNIKIRKQHYVLIGSNGSGKSTLMNLMAGFLWQNKGKILWNDSGIMESSRIIGQKITRLVSPALQESWQKQNWGQTSLEMLAAAAGNSPFSLAENTGKELELLTIMDALHLANMPLASMSQGQLRLLLFCRAILAKPKILLLDEFTDSLDKHAKQLALTCLEKIQGKLICIFATNRLNEVPEWANNFLKTENGTVQPATRANLPASAKIFPLSADLPKQQPVICEISHATVFIEGKEILHNLDWKIHFREHWRLTGANGSGKSTLLRLIAGDEVAAAGGSVQIMSEKGDYIDTLASRRKFAVLVSDLNQIRYEYDLKAWELVWTGLDNSIGIYRDWLTNEYEKAMQVIKYFFEDDNGQIANTSLSQLSTGQLRKLFLARAWVGQPILLLLDEPCNGLDEHSRFEFLQTLEQLATRGIGGWQPTIIITSHYESDFPPAIKREARLQNGHLEIIRE